MPSAVSILHKAVFAALRTGVIWLAFPDTAASGDALDALFAGVRDASSTVRMPMTAPAAMLGRLTANTGIVEKYKGLRKRRTAQSIQMMTMPEKMLAGMAYVHSPSASLYTMRIIWPGVAPTQRSIPKNCVRPDTVLFRLPAIIKMPASSTSEESTAAAAYSIIISWFPSSLCPRSPSSIACSPTCSCDSPNCVLMSSIVLRRLRWLRNWTRKHRLSS